MKYILLIISLTLCQFASAKNFTFFIGEHPDDPETKAELTKYGDSPEAIVAQAAFKKFLDQFFNPENFRDLELDMEGLDNSRTLLNFGWHEGGFTDDDIKSRDVHDPWLTLYFDPFWATDYMQILTSQLSIFAKGKNSNRVFNLAEKTRLIVNVTPSTTSPFYNINTLLKFRGNVAYYARGKIDNNEEGDFKSDKTADDFNFDINIPMTFNFSGTLHSLSLEIDHPQSLDDNSVSYSPIVGRRSWQSTSNSLLSPIENGMEDAVEVSIRGDLNNFGSNERSDFIRVLQNQLTGISQSTNIDLDLLISQVSSNPLWVNNINRLLTGNGSTADPFLKASIPYVQHAILAENPSLVSMWFLAGLTCDAPSDVLANMTSPDTNGGFSSLSITEYCETVFSEGKFFADGTDIVTATGVWQPAHGASFQIAQDSISNKKLPVFQKHIYSTVDECSLEMRVYKNNINESNLKPIMVIHGGGFNSRYAGYQSAEAQIAHLLEDGYVVFLPTYRLAGNGDAPSSCIAKTYKEMKSDVRSALNWAENNKTNFGVYFDHKIDLWGYSAGAFLALSLNQEVEYYRDSFLRERSRYLSEANLINRTVVLYPPTDMNAFNSIATGLLNELRRPLENGETDANSRLTDNEHDQLKMLREFFGKPLEELTRLDILNNSLATDKARIKSDKDIFTIHGASDGLVPISQSNLLCDALGGAFNARSHGDINSVYCGTNSNSIMHTISNVGHSFDISLTGGQNNSVARSLESARRWLHSDDRRVETIYIIPHVDGLVIPIKTKVDELYH